ncbi:probable sugar phosphate/phosphate translocator At1g06470 isoform X1 [Typha latifolia]|uniref:probable sugar phosphate/phosphate translocator At1g06470 isoform X1 n=1 Tax=Typha latifolia TaxID=4733 RepID=UPI003C2C8B5F
MGLDPTEEVEELELVEDAESETNSRNPVLRKEPSFSRWCDEIGVVGANDSLTDGSLINSASGDSEEFELPLLQGGGSKLEAAEKSMISGTANGDRMSYSSMDIENAMSANDSTSKPTNAMQAEVSSISVPFLAKILGYILVWYTLSICLTSYNKEMLGEQLMRFPAPLLMNTVQFTMQALLSRAIVYFRSKGSENRSDIISWRDYFTRVVPTALGTALDIDFSNSSLAFITVSFATMCKSASPIFLLLFAFAFRLEKPSFKLLGIIIVICSGVLFTVAKETNFEFWGFIYIMVAAVMSGFRWCLTQILLQKEAYGLRDPITLMSYITPVMAIATAVLSLAMDPWHDFRTNDFFDNSRGIIKSCLLMGLGGILAFFMVLTEYILVSATSAVTVTIAGMVKEAVTILFAVLFWNDNFTWLKGLGLVIIMLGACLFNWYKYQKLRKVQPNENGEANSVSNAAARYVILDDMESDSYAS